MERLAANIALLRLVTEAPQAPSPAGSTPPIESPTIASLRSISFKHEKLISQHLSFISAVSDDPLRVMATCLEEDHQKNCLVIRIAANSGKCEELLVSLKRVAAILQDESNNVNRETNSESLLRLVLTLNRKRILSRLRHKHATSSRKTRNRRSFLDRLGKAARLLRNSSIPDARRQGIIDQVNELNKLSELLDNMSAEQACSAAADEHILRLIQQINSFLTLHKTDLLCVPAVPGCWDPVSTAALLDRMGKLSQYVKACSELLIAARRYRIFSQVTCCFVDLQQTRLPGVFNERWSGRTLPNGLVAPGTVKRLAQRDERSQKDVILSLSGRLEQAARLHAEIQLLLYYEMHPAALPPRIITSSKRACYLCNLLFEIHGKYVKPDSHGRLYDSWKWPEPVRYASKRKTEIVSIDTLLPRFMAVIERQIKQGLEKQAKRPDNDCESRVSNGSFTATVVTTSSGDSVSTIRASPNIDVVASSSLGDSRRNIPSILSNRSSSQQSRATPRYEINMIEGEREGVQKEDEQKLLDTQPQRPHSSDSHATERDEKLPPELEVRSQFPQRQERHDSKGEDSWLPEDKPQMLESLYHKEDTPKLIDKISIPEEHSNGFITSLCVLQPGSNKFFSFDTADSHLRIWTPSLRLNLEWSAGSGFEIPDSDKEAMKQTIKLNIQWLDQASVQSQDGNAIVVDVNDIAPEKKMPEGAMFSESGFIVRREDTMIRLRVVA